MTRFPVRCHISAFQYVASGLSRFASLFIFSNSESGRKSHTNLSTLVYCTNIPYLSRISTYTYGTTTEVHNENNNPQVFSVTFIGCTESLRGDCKRNSTDKAQ